MTWLRGALCVSCAVMATRLYSSCFVQATCGRVERICFCVFLGTGKELVEFTIKLVDQKNHNPGKVSAILRQQKTLSPADGVPLFRGTFPPKING